MAYRRDGVKFVLTAPDAESTEQAFSPWKQMMHASAPAQFVPRLFYKRKFNQPRYEDGSEKVMPYGVRVAEEVLLRHHSDDDVVVCYPDDLNTFVGRRTVAAGVGPATLLARRSRPACTPISSLPRHVRSTRPSQSESTCTRPSASTSPRPSSEGRELGRSTRPDPETVSGWNASLTEGPSRRCWKCSRWPKTARICRPRSTCPSRVSRTSSFRASAPLTVSSR